MLVAYLLRGLDALLIDGLAAVSGYVWGRSKSALPPGPKAGWKSSSSSSLLLL